MYCQLSIEKTKIKKKSIVETVTYCNRGVGELNFVLQRFSYLHNEGSNLFFFIRSHQTHANGV